MQKWKKTEAIRRLAGGVAHEINNMLNVIHGNARLLQLQFEANSPLSEYVHEITGASMKASEISGRL